MDIDHSDQLNISSKRSEYSAASWSTWEGEEEEDDEEALKWAALERLPTYDRIRKGLLINGGNNDDDDKIVMVKKLKFHEKKGLVERLVPVVQVHNEQFLLKLRNRLDRAGIDLPTIEVRLEHLNIEGEAHVGTRALPTVINFFANIVEGFLNYAHLVRSGKKNIKILKDVSGIIKPNRMTLLLGPPSSGKTTLLLALAGKLDKHLKVSGKVTYNGHEMHEFVAERTAAYISQHDVHLGELTVRETLSLSSRFQGVGYRHEMLEELCRREKEANIKPDPDIDLFMKAAAMEGQKESVMTNYILKVLGLENCADTVVGDQMRRGISGGQKKRVTTGEMLVGPAKVLLMDEISTGLDSSTTFQIVKSLRQYVHVLNGTAIISLLQPPPETFDLFDDVILLSDGHIVYQGPRNCVLDFFSFMGFQCPARKGVADFLQEVTSKKDQEQYWAKETEPYSFITAEEFAKAFESFHVGRSLTDELSTPFDKSKNHPAALTTKMYGVGKKELFKACFSREFLLMRRNSFVHIFKLTQLTIMAFVVMTVFLRTKMNKHTTTPGGSVYTGALFYEVNFIMFVGMAEMSLTIAKLPVFYKQRDLLFFPPWAYALPGWILKIPMTLFEVGIWVFTTYYAIGFDPNVGRLFKQYLLLVLVNQTAFGMFRLIGATARNMIVANTFGSFALLVVFALGGFVLSRDNVKKWWIWGYWASPMMYAQNAVAVNEFLGKSWSLVLENTTEALGVTVLRSRGFFPYAYWYWIGLGALFGFTILFNLLYTAALTFLNPYGKHQVVSDRCQKDAQDGKARDKEQNNENRQNVPCMSCAKLHAPMDFEHTKKGMVLEFEQHSITFNEVRYSVDMPQEMKNQGITEDKLELLKGVSGAFRPGVLTALMGVSGAGKTTLMDVLAGRKTGGYIKGNITISGYPKKQPTFARISGYCEQTDVHSPHITVYESLIYSAWLRLPPQVDSESRKIFVEEVMELVELNTLREGQAGVPGVNGLSTEQRKRLTIAVELVANPSIIFMDEPTSGLDARAAAIAMRTVRNTVDTGRTVVCTIHQPSIDIFEAFDELLLLKRGGQEIYAGPLGHHSKELIKYFEGVEGVSKIKDGYNPATWMLEMTSPAQEHSLGVDFSEIYRNSELYRRNKALVQELSTPQSSSRELYFPTQYAQPFSSQFMACLWKQHWSYWRNPPYTASRFLFTIFVALMIGTIFWDLGGKLKTQQDLFNAMGSMYAAVIFLGIQNSSSVQPVVSIERTVFYRERAAGMYSALPYAFSQVIIEIPYILVQSTVYSVIVYAMVGFQWTPEKFFWYLFFMFFTLLSYTLYGMMAVAVTPNQHVAAIASTVFLTLWNLFSGFIIPRPRIPIWWRWFYWLSPNAWALYGLVTSQFGDVKDVLTSNNQTVEDFIRSYYGFKHDFLGPVVVVVAGLPVLFAFIFAFSVRNFNFQKR